MATMTRAEMIDRVLQRLGVLAAGQSASAEDAALVGPTIDSLHDQWRKKGLANYATTAFPEWAQEPFAEAMEEEAGPYFGMQRQGKRALGEKDTAEQMQAKRHPRAVKIDFF